MTETREGYVQLLYSRGRRLASKNYNEPKVNKFPKLPQIRDQNTPKPLQQSLHSCETGTVMIMQRVLEIPNGRILRTFPADDMLDLLDLVFHLRWARRTANPRISAFAPNQYSTEPVKQKQKFSSLAQPPFRGSYLEAKRRLVANSLFEGITSQIQAKVCINTLAAT